MLAFFGKPQNNVYKYPDIYVCLYNFFGCDDQQLEEDCMRSAQGTEGGISTAVFNQDMDNEQELRVDAFLTDDVRPRQLLIYVLVGSAAVLAADIPPNVVTKIRGARQQ